MTETAPSSQGLGVPARIIGVLFSPRPTFERIVAVPRVLGTVLVIVIVAAAVTTWFLSTETGQQALLDAQVSRMEAFGMTIGDEQYAAMEKSMRFAAYTSGIGILIVVPVMMLVVSGLLFLVFNVAMGGEAAFKQMFAVVAHAWVVTIPQILLVTPLNYVRGSMSSPTNLSVFLPMLDEGGFPARLLGMIDLFYIWMLVLLAIGLAVLYRRKTSSILTGLFVLYAVIAIGIAGVLSFVGRS